MTSIKLKIVVREFRATILPLCQISTSVMDSASNLPTREQQVANNQPLMPYTIMLAEPTAKDSQNGKPTPSVDTCYT